jgi:hypothetical protein
MNYYEIRGLFSYLEDNRDHLNSLQSEFVTYLKDQYKRTGLVTPGNIENLVAIKEKIPVAMSIE